LTLRAIQSRVHTHHHISLPPSPFIKSHRLPEHRQTDFAPDSECRAVHYWLEGKKNRFASVAFHSPAAFTAYDILKITN
jgi:hypothetical protein